MHDRENQLDSPLGVSGDRQREEHRLNILQKLGLLDNTSVPVFEEATQTVAHYLQVPVCILGILDREVEWLKAAFGLSRLGLMNDLAARRSMAREHSLTERIVISRKKLIISDLAKDPDLNLGFLHQEYGIRAYLGIPLIISEGDCIGSLAVMDLEPHTFSPQEISYLEMTARWSLSEFERSYLLKIPSSQTGLIGISSTRQIAPETPPSAPLIDTTSRTKNQLLNHLTQELRTPLTSVLGMAKMLNKETYGPLTPKQKEYMTIIYNSGQNLLSLINEILELGVLDEITPPLKIKPIDVEMLCQQATTSLEELAEQQQQQIRLSIEPGNRIWNVDKVLVQQTLYHLISSVIQAAAEESIIRLHASRKEEELNLTVWISHPWLGEGIPDGEKVLKWFKQKSISARLEGLMNPDNISEDSELGSGSTVSMKTRMQFLRLDLSYHLAKLHRGSLEIQGTSAANYRYLIRLIDKKG